MTVGALLPWLGFVVTALGFVAAVYKLLRVERPTVKLAQSAASEQQRDKLLDQVIESARFLGERVPELEKENTACREQGLILQERISALNDRITTIEAQAMEATRALVIKHAEEVTALNAAVARLTLRLATYEIPPAGATP